MRSQFPILFCLLLAGAASVLSFAPLEWPGFIFAALACLFWAIHRAPNARQAVLRSFVFGLGYFVGNVHWIYISMHSFGGMPAVLAAGCILLFSAYLALFPMLAALLYRRLPCPEKWRLPLLIPSLFILLEWFRGWLFTGFPWSSVGTSQTQLMAGWFPLLGVYGVGWLLALCAAWCVWNWRYGLALLLAMLCASWGLQYIEWTQPEGEMISVSLVQGGIPQSERWDPKLLYQALDRYAELIHQSRGQLVLLPEAAIPTLRADLPESYLRGVRGMLKPRGATLVAGFMTGDSSKYYNSVVTLTGSEQIYSKHHLVPFGEFVPAPVLFGWMYEFMDMPMSGFARGEVEQAPIRVGQTRLGVNICYEDIFGDELRLGARQSSLLVNVSNMAWFDGSWAAQQHLQMARARALETGRWMIQSTNTGATAVIDQHGRIVDQLAPIIPAVLESRAENRTGITPYMRWGDWLILLTLLGGVLGLAALGQYQSRSRQAIVKQ